MNEQALQAWQLDCSYTFGSYSNIPQQGQLTASYAAARTALEQQHLLCSALQRAEYSCSSSISTSASSDTAKKVLYAAQVQVCMRYAERNALTQHCARSAVVVWYVPSSMLNVVLVRALTLLLKGLVCTKHVDNTAGAAAALC
eukprot:12227-Heterococcus_DN1.PRE.1